MAVQVELQPPGISQAVHAALDEWHMLEGVRRLGVAVSGGADSCALLRALARVLPAHVQMTPLFVHQYPTQQPLVLQQAVRDWTGTRLVVLRKDTTDIAERQVSKGRAPCSRCAPIRARVLAKAAHELDLQAIALGHHLTDVGATLLMNIFHAGRVETMRPVTYRSNAPDVRIIRPLFFVTERRVKAASPVGPGGLFDCGVCSRHASERDRMQRLVQQTLDAHGEAAFLSLTSVVRDTLHNR